MKTMSSFACLGALFAAGCATHTAARQEPPNGGKSDVNARYVATIEENAMRRGMTVIWVNTPAARRPALPGAAK